MHRPVPPLATLGLALSCVALSACGKAEPASQEPQKQEAQQEAPPVQVQTAPVTMVDAPELLRLTGTLRGLMEADLAANAAGKVVRTFVERGEHVKAGQPLAQLDTQSAALSLAEADLQVETSRTQEKIQVADCERYTKLRDKGVISALEYDQATAKCKTAPLTLEVAEARKRMARKQVGDGTIRAPFAGVVSERYVDVGEYVQPSSRVVSLAKTESLRLQFSVPEAHLARIAEGAKVSFTVAAYPGKTFQATVRFISGAVRAATRDLVVEAVVDELQDAGEGEGRVVLRPGMFADVGVNIGTSRRPAVPTSAVLDRDGKKHVFAVVDGRLQERLIHHGPVVDGQLVVQDGLREGEQVVASELTGLVNGARVK